MGLKDRPYWRDEQPSGGGGGGSYGGGMTVGMPRPGKAVKYLLLINIAVFMAQLVFRAGDMNLSDAFGATVAGWWQVWRYLTFQFLHDPHNLWHLGLNMLALYMLGSPLERHWGFGRFLKFYLSCGAFAGVAYVVMAALLIPVPSRIPLIGASGGVYAILLACAVLFPHFRLIFLFFPVPIRLAAIVIFGGMILFVLSSISAGHASGEFWSQVAHLGGAAAAAASIWVLPKARDELYKHRRKASQGTWQRRMDKSRREQEEIDRILDKIRDRGLDSLSRSERQRLQRATNDQRHQERQMYK
jgi:membrane associated rhomboid family serine protease